MPPVRLGLQSEDVVVAHIHREVAECLWEKEAKGRPLCVSNWPLWRGRAGYRAPSPMFGWHGAFRPVRGRAGQTEEAPLGLEQNLRTPSVAFSTVKKRETGRARDRWAHPPPAGTATSICPQPRQLSPLLVITALTAHSLHPFPLLFTAQQNEEDGSFSTLQHSSDQRFYSAACGVLLQLLSTVVRFNTKSMTAKMKRGVGAAEGCKQKTN